MLKPKLASSILVGKCGKAPEVTQSCGEAYAGNEEVELVAPRPSFGHSTVGPKNGEIECSSSRSIGGLCRRQEHARTIVQRLLTIIAQ